MNFHEHLLWSEVAGLLDATRMTPDRLAEAFQQPQVEPKNHGQEVQHMKQWWSNWTDPRGKIEKAKRLVQDVLNKVGREGMRGQSGEDLVPMLTDLRARLIRAYTTMPDPMKNQAGHQTPKLDYQTSTAGSAAI